jgi:integrase
MVKAGAHPKVLQELMGHTHYNVTMDLYTVLDESQKREAMELLQRMRDGLSSNIPATSGE